MWMAATVRPAPTVLDSGARNPDESEEGADDRRTRQQSHAEAGANAE
jgi:hypothetical protein